MSSSEAEQEPALFEGLTFLVHGPQAGRTRSQMQRLIEGNGGDVTKHPSSEYLSHCVLSAQLWGKQGTKNPDHILRELVKRNQENATEDDPDHNRVWLLPLEWLDKCIKKGRRLDEEAWDFERRAEGKRVARAEELKKERDENHGKSRFARGERKRYEREQRDKEELELQEKLEMEGGFDAEEALSGIAAVQALSTADDDPTSADVLRDLGQERSKAKKGRKALPESRSSSPVAVGSSKPRKKSRTSKPDKLADVKPEASSSSTASKPKPKVNPEPVRVVTRTLIQPTAKPSTKAKASMWGDIKRPLPKAPAPSKTSGTDLKGKGKAAASMPDAVTLESSSSDDEPLATKARKAGASGSSSDAAARGKGNGKKRARESSSSDLEVEPASKSKGKGKRRKGKGKKKADDGAAYDDSRLSSPGDV